jgi:hypothetical protein
MRKLMFALLALTFSLFGTQCWAQSCGGETQPPCAPPPITNTFSPGTTEGVYDFGIDGRLVVDFDTVLTTFTLTVTVDHTIDPIDFSVFPSGTVCVPYTSNGNQCDEYDFTGSAGGPNGVPVKNQDYKRMITLTLTYEFFGTVHNPAFGHAPGDNATAVYSEDILTSYSQPISDPTMGGTLPGLSSVVAFDELLTENDTICIRSPQAFQIISAALTKEIEVTFQLYAGSSCSGTPMRDKTARFSLSTIDPTTSNVVFPPLRDKEEGNKFHWDNKDGLNEFDLSTVGLPTNRTYTITVFSSKASPQSVSFFLAP